MDNKEKVRKRINEMLKDDFKQLLNKEIDKELNRRYITEEHTEDYRMAKAVLYEALKNLAWQYQPLNDLKF